MCVSCGHKCTQFPDKASVPEDQDLEEVARGLYAAGTISFKLPTTTASALPADSFGATAAAGVAPMGTAMRSAGTGSVGLNSITPHSAATYSTAPHATLQYTIAPNATAAYAPTQYYYSAPHTIAPNTTAAYAPTQYTTAPYQSAPYATAPYTAAPQTFAPYTTAPFFATPTIQAQPLIATPAPSTPIPEPQLQPTDLLVPSNSLAAPFALMTRPTGILENRTGSERQVTTDPHASYMDQENEEYQYPEPSRQGYYMALSRQRRG
ncbi:hypothetical protein KC318_g7024 [Hortaea werneckii]|nr:hypothetical protein KC334_g7223 [Hortaea werneckii]KAI6956457.1 hypothetical protein KC355_g13225 [Hortaea werneckii]KAI7188113.1 hypothetical protein KC324_g6704 [Hortaea werneckii]KAI7582576.1 hypothetical protein KC316_g7778 [Hortaea werneckii]KAI7665606.1 hypothetical protein KC318_g7024 [Hortaea werneckii]